jgi:hypothetical protein
LRSQLKLDVATCTYGSGLQAFNFDFTDQLKLVLSNLTAQALISSEDA